MWTNYYNGPANGNDGASAVAVDSNGNVFVIGNSDPGSATIKYSNAGAPLWTNRYNGDLTGIRGGLLAVDSSGNVFVAGSSYNEINLDYTTVAYSNAGVPLWTNRYNGPNNSWDSAQGIAVDSSGAVYVAGDSYATWGAPLRPHAGGNSDGFVAKLSSSGELTWHTFLGSSSGDFSTGIAVDSSGNVYVAGTSVATRDTGNGAPTWSPAARNAGSGSGSTPTPGNS
jgi:hypothetical protein